jgi:hypothetical protein
MTQPLSAPRAVYHSRWDASISAYFICGVYHFSPSRAKNDIQRVRNPFHWYRRSSALIRVQFLGMERLKMNN